MSYVDNYVLFLPCGKENDRAIEAVNHHLKAIVQGDGFQRIDGYAGGKKALEATIYAFTGNYMSPDALARVLSAAPWDWPDLVQVAHKGQDDEAFALYALDAFGKEG